MSFRYNSSQQMSLYDTAVNNKNVEQFLGLKKNAKLAVFATEIFPKIDEEPFTVLFSKGDNSRPNVPINVIIGALLLKDYFHMSDDVTIMSLHTNPLFQYLLHTSSMEVQPLSYRTLSRFRRRVYLYEETNGIDLIHECLVPLYGEMANMMNIGGRVKRMDSMMIETSAKKLCRFELLFDTFSRLVMKLHKLHLDTLIEGLEIYTYPEYENEVIYRSSTQEALSKADQLLVDICKLIPRCDGNTDVECLEEYKILKTVVDQQTIENDENSRRLKTPEEGLNGGMIQTPTDPTATYREKNGTGHTGQIANVTESVSDDDGPKRSIVTDYQVEQNLHSDTKFITEALNELPDSDVPKEGMTTMITDGGYFGNDIIRLASQKGVNLITTELKGKETEDIYADFKLSEDGTQVITCPAGEAPKEQSYSSSLRRIRISMDKDKCAGCPHYNLCHPRIWKTKATKYVPVKAVTKAAMQRIHDSEQYKDYCHLRNGVETIPSILRRCSHIDELPVRGLDKVRFWFGFKIGGLNLGKLFRYLNQQDKCAQNSEKS